MSAEPRRTDHRSLSMLAMLLAVTSLATAEEEWRCVNPTVGQTPLCHMLWDVHSDGSQFVAVGERGKLMTSADGISWQDCLSGSDEDLYGVTSNGSVWIVVGTGGTVLTSVDGQVWTTRSSGTTSDLMDVAWAEGSGLFVAVGGKVNYYSVIRTSPDGITWTTRSHASSSGLRGVACDSLRCVAVGSSGQIETSTDGVSWGLATSNTGAYLNGAASSGSLWVAVGQGSSYGYPFIVTSSDGQTWTPRESGSSILNGVVWSGSQFVTVGQYGLAYTSPDGITWTVQSSATGRTLRSVAFDGTTYVAVGHVALDTSGNGSSWTDRLTGNVIAINEGLNSVIWTGWQYIAVGDRGTLLTSPDGTSWWEHTAVSTRDLSGVALGVGSQFTYVAAAQYGRVYTSDDLDTWTERTTETGGDLRAIASNGYRFVAVCDDGTVQTSQLGDVWTTATTNTFALYGVVWTGSQFVAVGKDGVVLTSPDGTVWTEQVPGSVTQEDLHDVVWDGSRLLASGHQGFVAVSADGSSWVFNDADPEFRPLYGIGATPSWRVAVGALGKVVASDDASAAVWSTHDSRITLSLQDVGSNGSCFAAAGDGGVIITWCPPVFSDGFESGDLTAWSASTP